MEPGVIAGTISTTVFTLSNIPMLLKAARTHNLQSYSYTYIIMNNLANLIHWLYISAMPFGPIWVLHGFYTVSSVLILLWYLRYEKGYQVFSSNIRKALALPHLRRTSRVSYIKFKLQGFNLIKTDTASAGHL
jgi:uncharacterized protein with PQ loop repeat